MRIHARLRLGTSPVACLLLASFAIALPASAETAGKDHGYEVLHSFTGSDGANPYDTVAEDGSGNFVGTTYNGGANGLGTVYRMTPDGTLTTLYSFSGTPDGQNPVSLPRLSVDKAGNIYGTTFQGGNVSGCSGICGTVFKISPDGTETVLHNFTGGDDGYQPLGGVNIEKTTGNLYGATSLGSPSLDGAVYKLAPDGTLTIVSDKAGSNNGLIEDKHLNIYGTVAGADGWGAVLKFAPNGYETIMYAFQDNDDGANPLSALIRDKAGNLYGTTSWVGANGGGTIFKIAPDGLLTTLYSFVGTVYNEPYPSTLVMDKNGNLYGTAEAYGTYGDGFIFELTSAGKFITRYSFHGSNGGSTDGAAPWGGLTLVGDYLYGTTLYGGGTGCGGKGCGTVFRMKI